MKDSPLSSELVQNELSLTKKTIKINPKSYSPWFHRQWFIGIVCGEDKILNQELDLCNMFLEIDCRNFHCWDYRRFIVGHLTKQNQNEVLQKEFEYSYLKITQNFSNYSAWHYRSKLLPVVSTDESIVTNLLKELELCRSAYYTEPKDQSVWMYVLWIFSQLKLQKSNFMQIVEAELEHLQVLQDMEEDNTKELKCKFSYSLFDLGPLFVSSMLKKEIGCSVDEVFCKLSAVDPFRKEFYQYAQKTTFFI